MILTNPSYVLSLALRQEGNVYSHEGVWFTQLRQE